jgi:hypothetical protein
MSKSEQTLGVEERVALGEGKKSLPAKGETRGIQSGAETSDLDPDTVTRAAALAVVVIGVALIEVELLAGVALGAAALAAPQLIPIFRSAVRKILGSSGEAERRTPAEG